MPYQHQHMHNLLHGSQYISPYGSSLFYGNHFGNHFSSQYQMHGYRPHYLLPHAPPTSQQHSPSSSFSSAQQLSALQKQQLQSQAQSQAQAQTQTQSMTQSRTASSKTHMPLFSAFSLRGSSHNKMTTHSSASQQQLQQPLQQQQQKKTTQKQQQTSAADIKPPARAHKSERNRGPVDAKELSLRLNKVLSQRALDAAARANSSDYSLSSGTASLSPVSPLTQQGTFEPFQSRVGGGDRSGRRIRSRGSGNLRAVYASHGAMPPTSSMAAPAGSSGSIRRQPFSAPQLGALVLPPSLSELESRHNRKRSLSPQLVNMCGGGGGAESGVGPSGTTIAQRRASANTIPPSNAQCGMPYIPSQAAQQFARTTVATGGTRKLILMQKPKQPYHHNQNMTRTSPPPTAQAPTLSSPTTGAPALQHAFRDSLSLPGSKRQSLKNVTDGENQPVEAEADIKDTVAEEAADPEAEQINADVEEVKDMSADRVMAAAELNRIVQEHSVDWTQSDETSVQRKKQKQEKKDKKEREKQTRPLWRLKARLSSFSKDKLLSSSPVVTVVAVAEEAEDKKDKGDNAVDVVHITDEIPRALHVESSTVEVHKNVVSTLGNASESSVSTTEPVVESIIGAPVAVQPTSKSPSVLSFTALAKSSSFLLRFKH